LSIWRDSLPAISPNQQSRGVALWRRVRPRSVQLRSHVSGRAGDAAVGGVDARAARADQVGVHLRLPRRRHWPRRVPARGRVGITGASAPLPPTLLAPLRAAIGDSTPQLVSPTPVSPLFPPKERDRFALGHASMPAEEARRAVILTDDCAIDTALAQGRERRSVGGRLLFAPLRQVDADTHEKLRERPDFGRFPLPSSQRFGAEAVVELRHTFMVEAQHIKAHASDRVLAATTALAEELEAHWNAYAARRGPIAYERNCLKLAELVGAPGSVDEQHERDAFSVATLLDRVWRLEGGDLEVASTAYEQLENALAEGGDVGALARPVVEGLIRGLREIAELAEAAATTLERYR
jgi:hypothetical protein